MTNERSGIAKSLLAFPLLDLPFIQASGNQAAPRDASERQFLSPTWDSIHRDKD